MSTRIRHVLPILQILILALAILLQPPLVARASDKGDILVLFDQSESMRIYNPGFFINQWLFDFIKTLPGSSDVVVAGFHEKVNSSIIISRKEVESTRLLQAKLETLKLAGRVTDFEHPLQFLLNYKGDISMAFIITDGEPDIWDKRLVFLSKSILSDARYREQNERYKFLRSQGLGQEELHRKLFNLYFNKNIGFIEKRLIEVKKKLGSQLVFIDVYGKLNFLKRWSELASARLIVAQSPKEAIQKLAGEKSPESQEIALAEIVTFGEKSMENKLAEDASHPVKHPQGQADMAAQPVNIVSLPPLTVTLGNAKEIFPGIASSGYKSDMGGGILAVGISVLVMALLWLTREFSLKQSRTARKMEAEREQSELHRINEEKIQLEQEQRKLNTLVCETTDDLSRLQDEKADCEYKLANLKQSIDKTAEEYKQKKFAEADSEALAKSAELEELRQERKKAIEKELELIKAEKLTALDKEMEAEKAIQAEVMCHELAAKFKDEEETYAQKMQSRKEKALEDLTNWKIEETARQQQELANELAKTEAESKEKIDDWEQEAAVRVQSLLESRYLDQKEKYKNDLRLLAEKRDAAEKSLTALILEIETQQDELERRRHEIKQEIGDQERKMLTAFKEQESLLWQETVIEAKEAKEEAMARVRKWEKEERERVLGTLHT